MKNRSNNYIKDIWENQAKQFKDSHWASWGDKYAMELEIRNISKYINKGDAVLDVGCANGYATIKQLEERKPNKLVGIDISKSMIHYAKANKLKNNISNEKLEFKVGNILGIDFDDNTFDITYTTRVIINLPTWKEQISAILECIRVTKIGGTIVLSEAFWEPLVLLNSLRAMKNLSPLIEHDYNRYIKEKNIHDFLTKRGYIFEIIDFSSIYYLGSRFLRELVTDYKKYEGYSNPINEIFYNIELDYSGGGFGIQKAVVITK